MTLAASGELKKCRKITAFMHWSFYIGSAKEPLEFWNNLDFIYYSIIYSHTLKAAFNMLLLSLCAEGLSNSWKDNGSAVPFTPSSNSSSGGYWSWSAPSDQSNPSTPSPPLSADSFKPFRVPSLGGVGSGPTGPEDPSLDDQDGTSLLFDEPIPRKRKVRIYSQCWGLASKNPNMTCILKTHVCCNAKTIFLYFRLIQIHFLYLLKIYLVKYRLKKPICMHICGKHKPESGVFGQ